MASRVEPGARRRRSPGHRGAAPAGLLAASALVVVCFAAPFGYLLLRAAGLGEVFWRRLADAGALAPLLRTILLGATVSTATAALGLACAWLVARTDLPGRGAWSVLLALPLVLPSYIGAFTLRAAFAPGGLLDEVLAPVASVSLPVEGYWAAFGVLTLLTFPYVYLPTAARLRQVPAALEESARLLGRGPWATFRTVVLPQCRGAVLAGALLVFLYTISDFGAVQLLRYDTLTRVIFASVLDQAGAVTFSLQLGVLALAVVAVERLVTAADRSAARPLARGARPLRVRLGGWRTPAVVFVGAVVTACLLAPVTVLGYWAARGIASSGPESALGAAAVPLLGSLVNTAGAGLAAAVAAVLIVLPVAYLTVRHRGRVAGAANAVVVGGFALPGLVVALTLVVLTLRGPLLLASAYQTLPLLVFAYVVHFGAQSLRAAQVGVAAIPPRVDDAARLLGAGRLRRLVVVELPLLAPALLAGGGLVLLSTMKELPATLLLAPAGFSTLATDIWNLTEEAFWADASLAALLLVALSGALTWVLVLRRADALA